jgi:hypothetical protein
MSVTPNFSWPLIEPTDFVTNLPADFEAFADDVDADVYALDQAAVKKTLIDAKGDLLAGTAADTIARLAVGSNGQVLTADSGETAGMKWAAPGGGFGWELIGSTTSTAVATVTFTFSGYENLLLSAVTSASAGSMANRVQLNGVTTNTYRNGGARFDSAPSATRTNANSLNDSMDIQPGTATTGDVVTTALFTGCNKSAYPTCTYNTIATFSTTRILMFGSCVSENNAPVTSLTFYNLNGTNFGSGTSIYLYGAK